MSSRRSDEVVNAAASNEENGIAALEYLLELERKKYSLLVKNGCVDYEALRARLRALEVDIDGLSTSFSSAVTGENDSDIDDVPSSSNIDHKGLENVTQCLVASPSSEADREMDLSHISFENLAAVEGETAYDMDVRRSSLRSTGSAKERHTMAKAHRRLSIGSHPLYTMPNAFQYGIQLRDTKMNGMSMYEDQGGSNSTETATSPADKRVQGSRERECNIRNITDKFSDSLNGTERASIDLRRALGSPNEPVNRTSFSMQSAAVASAAVSSASSGAGAHMLDNPKRMTSTEYGHASASALAKSLLSGHSNALLEDFEGDVTDSPAPKRHSINDLTDAMEEGDLCGENISATSSAPEGSIEFCIVEADWKHLHLQSQQGHLLTPLLPPCRSWRYPLDLMDDAENNTKELQDQSFFFPSGVKVDLVWPSVAALRSRSNKHIRHIVPFTDAQGKPTYACVLTVTQTYDVSEIAQLGDLILPNLVNINKQKQSAMCIQKCFRQYTAYRKMVTWQLHKAVSISKAPTNNSSTAADSPLQRSTTIFGRVKDKMLDSSTHGSTGTASTTDEKNPGGGAAPRRTWTSFFSSTRTSISDTMDSSIHNNNNNQQQRNSTSSAGAGESSKRPPGGSARSSSITGVFTSSAASTPTKVPTPVTTPHRAADAAQASGGIAVSAADRAQAESKRKQQQQESQAEYIRRRVAVAQKAYCIISTSREYTFIFKVLDAIAAAEGFTETRKQAIAPLPFSSTLSTDDDESDDGYPTGRSSSCSGSDFMNVNGASPVANVVSSAVVQAAGAAGSDSHRATSGDYSSDDMVGDGSLHTPSGKSNSLCAAMDAYYQQFRLKRDRQRNQFLQDVECFLLEHLTTPTPSAIQQITTEFAFSPDAALAAQGAKLKTTGSNKAGSRGLTDSMNSPIMRQNLTKRAFMNSAGANSSSAGQRSVLSKQTLAHVAACRHPNNTNAYNTTASNNSNNSNYSNNNNNINSYNKNTGKTEESLVLVDINNRFSHYTESGTPSIYHIKSPGYIEDFRVDLKALLTTKEWTCSVLFTHLSSTIIFKIINLLLMEKSLIIHGKNAGIVTTITMAVINLISPFLWEGIFVPLVPDNARELFGAPVPLVVGTTSAPRVNDVSSDTAILFLNDDSVSITTYPDGTSSAAASIDPSAPRSASLKFVAWFVRLPEVSADLPLEYEMCRRIDYTSSLLCNYVRDKVEIKEEPAPSSGGNTRFSTSKPSTPLVVQQPTPQGPVERVCKVTNTIDSVLMTGLPVHILHHVRVLIVALKRFNYGFCGCVISDPGSWKRFLRHSNRTGADEFYPEYFMEPLRNHLEFQDAIVHTQLFVSFMDKLRKEQALLDTIRRFIAEWIYFRTFLRKKRSYLNHLQALLDR